MSPKTGVPKNIKKTNITKAEFLSLKEMAYSEIIRESYLLLEDNRISIKKYLGRYLGLNRVEVNFNSFEEEKVIMSIKICL